MRRIVVVGSGIGALEAAKELEKHLEGRQRIDLSFVVQSNHFVYRPLLPHVVSGSLDTPSLSIPFRDLVAGETNLVVDRPSRIDIDNRQVVCDQHRLPFDYLVYSPEAVVDWGDCDTCRQFAQPLHTVGDAADLRQAVRARDELAATYLVIGAGPSGVELACQLQYALDATSDDDRRVVLLERSEQLLPDVPESVRLACRDHLETAGVEFKSECAVRSCGPDGVELADESLVEATCSVWCGGRRMPDLARRSDLPTDDLGRVRVDETLRAVDAPGVYAVGEAVSPSMSSSQADVVASQGKTAAKNVVADLSGRAPHEWAREGTKWLISLGPGEAVVYHNGAVISGAAGWSLYQFAHLSLIPGAAKKFGLAGAWLKEGLRSREKM